MPLPVWFWRAAPGRLVCHRPGTAGIHLLVDSEPSARHGSADQRTRGLAVGKKCRTLEWIVPGLVVHVVTASCGDKRQQEGGTEHETVAPGTLRS